MLSSCIVGGLISLLSFIIVSISPNSLQFRIKDADQYNDALVRLNEYLWVSSNHHVAEDVLIHGYAVFRKSSTTFRASRLSLSLFLRRLLSFALTS